ncbi:MAG: TrmH family RNA methyltransferase, partial [Dongiaceae bacterium]
SYVFTIAAQFEPRAVKHADTSDAAASLPLHEYADVAALQLPRGCQLVGIELLPEGIDLPSFRHPLQAAYVLGAERGSLSPALLARCDHIVRIPTRFCLNVAMAGALVMYDRMLSFGRFAERPVRAGGPTVPQPAHVHGEPIWKRKLRRRLAAATQDD